MQVMRLCARPSVTSTERFPENPRSLLRAYAFMVMFRRDDKASGAARRAGYAFEGKGIWQHQR